MHLRLIGEGYYYCEIIGLIVIYFLRSSPRTILSKCPRTILSKCPRTILSKCPRTILSKCPRTILSKCQNNRAPGFNNQANVYLIDFIV